MCFEILGFDVILDSKLKPWLLEINFTPSFNCDSPLDLEIKSGVIEETMRIINVSEQNRKRYELKQMVKLKRQTLTKKKRQFDIYEKAKIIQETQVKKTAHEDKVLRNFERIFPLSVRDPLDITS